ncbi:MAG: tetratricopeptide repeat protein [Pseudomonadota bacterium]
MSFFQELKRRNVIRVAIGYVVVGWALVEASDLLLETFDAPDWIMRAVVLTLAGGLPIALIVAWMFELTPEGIKREDGVDTSEEVRFKARADRKTDLVIMGVLALAVGYFILEKIWQSDAVRGEQLRAIAVLPFADMSAQRDQEYFAEGLTVELLNLLSRKTDLKVTGRTSAFQFKNHEGDFKTIGKTLGVGTILEGSVRAVDNNVRISTSLIDADQGKTLWSAKFDRQLTNIFQVQDEIAQAVVDALEGRLLNKPEEEPEERAVVAAAYKAYQQGNYLQGLISVENQQQAIDYFNQARAADPDFAEPLVGLANANMMLALNLAALDRELGIDRATALIDEALKLGSELPDAYVARALIKQVIARDYTGAEIDLKRALDIDPNHITALRRLGTIYGRFGRYDEAMESFQRIVDRDPLNHLTYSNYSLNALAAGKVDLAEEMISKVLEFKPDSGFANYQLSKVMLAQDNLDAAREANARETSPIWRTIGNGMIACKAQETEAAYAIADDLIAQREVFNASEIYGLCGDSEKVFELLNQAADARDPALIEMKLSWQLAYLRDDPRWHAVLKKIGLPI